MSEKLEALQKQYKHARSVYDNTGEEVMTDAEFDKLEDRIRKLNPTWPGLRKTGSGVIGKKKPVKLPHYMPSLDKCKVGDDTLPKFLAKASRFSKNLVGMAKLDGSSVFARYLSGKLTLLATRGDGETGKDITFLAPHLKNLPKDVVTLSGPFTGDIRMEAVIPKKVFSKKFADDGFSSARALVSGILNRHDGEAPGTEDINFVCLRLLTHKRGNIELGQGFVILQNAGFEVVTTVMVPKLLVSERYFEGVLGKILASSVYEMDGLVIHADTDSLVSENKKPDFAFSFKKDLDVDSAPKTTIREIVWKASSFGVLVPKAIVDPVDFEGVTVKQCALHNYAWAVEKGVGVGAEVGILRSGEIIPKIVKVYKRAKVAFPSRAVWGPYSWDDTNTNLVLDRDASGNIPSKEVAAQTLVRFFGHCELEHLGPSLAELMVEGGYDSTAKLVTMIDEDRWIHVMDSRPMARKYAAAIVKYRANPNLAATMAASGCFPKGVGRTRIETLLKAHPKLHAVLTNAELASKNQRDVALRALDTPGCGEVFSTALAQGWPAWVKWLKVAQLSFIRPERKVPTTGKLNGALVSFTSYRDKAHEQWVAENGGTVVTFGAKTSVLLYKDGGKISGKIAEAQKRGIKVTTFEQFKKG